MIRPRGIARFGPRYYDFVKRTNGLRAAENTSKLADIEIPEVGALETQVRVIWLPDTTENDDIAAA